LNFLEVCPGLVCHRREMSRS